MANIHREKRKLATDKKKLATDKKQQPNPDTREWDKVGLSHSQVYVVLSV